MKNIKKNIIVVILTLFCLFNVCPSLDVYAAEGDTYLALGNDLSAEQRATVLSLMGLTEDDVSKLNVTYITNEMEHEYLDEYIDSSVIGKNALSSVCVKQTAEGSGIKVTTHNINYCTVSMYKNALVTAGVENADVTVAGPFSISGTAALIGAMKAYEDMTGTKLDKEAKDVAVDELVTIGEITENLSDEEKAKVEEIINEIKAKVIADGITDKDEIQKIIDDVLAENGITLSDEEKEILNNLMSRIGELDIDPAKLLSQVGDLYDKYGEDALKSVKNAASEVLTDENKQKFWNLVVDLGKSLWNKVKEKLN